MKGIVRAKGKCPECDSDFRYFKKLGYICPSCKITPRRFYIDLYHKQRIRIFSDKQGQALDTYQRAINLLSHINYEIKNHSFDPSKFVKAELERFYACNLLDRFFQDKIDSISRKRHYKQYTAIAKEYFKSMDVREIRKLDLSDFKKHLISKYYPDQPKQGKTLKNILDHFKTFMIHCMKEYEVIDRVPSFPDIEMQPYQFKWIGQDDQISIYQLAEEYDKPLIAFLMLHGCRPGEARALKCKDIDLRQQTITITATFSESET